MTRPLDQCSSLLAAAAATLLILGLCTLGAAVVADEPLTTVECQDFGCKNPPNQNNTCPGQGDCPVEEGFCTCDVTQVYEPPPGPGWISVCDCFDV